MLGLDLYAEESGFMRLGLSGDRPRVAQPPPQRTGAFDMIGDRLALGPIVSLFSYLGGNGRRNSAAKVPKLVTSCSFAIIRILVAMF